MHFATVFTLGAAVVSASASLFARQSLPACYDTCAASANYSGCAGGVTNTTCLCKDAAFINSTTQCLMQTCTGSDLQQAITDAQQICLAVGVTLTASSSAPTASSTGAASSTGSASSSSPTASSSSSGSVPAGTNGFMGLAAAIAVVALAL